MEKKLVNADHPKKYVILEHLNLPSRGIRFWSQNKKNNTHNQNGELWYKEIAFTDNEKEAIDLSKETGELPLKSEIYSYYAQKDINNRRDR